MSSPAPVAVLGEALVDLALAPDGSIAAHLGGGPFNTARTLGRLGTPVAFVGRLSTDAFGRRLRAALAGDGVDLRAAADTGDPTTLALAELDERGAASYRFYVAGTSVPGLTTAEARQLLGSLPVPGALHVGTLALVLEPLAQATEAVVADLAGRALVVVDPNVRPAVIADEPAYRARLGRVLAGAGVVKASEDDLAWLVPGRPLAEAAAWLLEQGPRLALVTRGGDGVLVAGRGFTEAVAAPRVAVADTIGAGDAFAGGVLAWWHDHGRPDLAEREAALAATRFACRVAAATVARAGAQPPRRDELDALVPA